MNVHERAGQFIVASIILEGRGEKPSLSALCKATGVRYATLYMHLCQRLVEQRLFYAEKQLRQIAFSDRTDQAYQDWCNRYGFVTYFYVNMEELERQSPELFSYIRSEFEIQGKTL